MLKPRVLVQWRGCYGDYAGIDSRLYDWRNLEDEDEEEDNNDLGMTQRLGSQHYNLSTFSSTQST